MISPTTTEAASRTASAGSRSAASTSFVDASGSAAAASQSDSIPKCRQAARATHSVPASLPSSE